MPDFRGYICLSKTSESGILEVRR